MFKKNILVFIKSFTIVGLLLHAASPATADDTSFGRNDLEKTYLVQIINQLDAMQPFIVSAEQAQLPNKRIQFHYSRYQDNQGQWHAGLLEDIHSIKAGVLEYLHQPTIEPRVVVPLKNDYVNVKPVAAVGFSGALPVSSVLSEEGTHDARGQ